MAYPSLKCSPVSNRALAVSLLAGALAFGGLLVSPTALAKKAGRVLTAVGEVNALQPEADKRRNLQRRSWVQEGEVITLGEDARAQIRFKDGAIIRLRSDSRFRIHKYRQGEDEGETQVFMELVKGGMQTLTGQIGNKDKDNYRVETPVASVGIRGTHYAVRYCQGQCGADLAKGLYGSVLDGGIVVSNAGGRTTFGENAFFHVPNKETAPQAILRPDTDLVGGSRSGGQDAEQDEDDEGGQSQGSDGSGAEGSGQGGMTSAEAPAGPDPETDTEGATDGARTETFDYESGEEEVADRTAADEVAGGDIDTGIVTGNIALFALTAEASGESYGWAYGVNKEIDGMDFQVRDSDGAVTQIHMEGQEYEVVDFRAAEDAEPVDVGSSGGADVRWGRWNSGDYTLDWAGESANPGDFHYAVPQEPTEAATLEALDGRARFAYAGGTTPTGSGGNWQLDQLEIAADFGQMTVENAVLAVSGPRDLELRQATPSEISGTAPGFYITTESDTASGHITGAFTGSEASGAAVTYGITSYTETGSQSVAGAAALERQ